jgi:hypothetical protein
MVDLARQSHMTDVMTVPRNSLARTIVGMAHFAGTGPAGQTCGSCAHWQTPHGKKILICDKFRQMTGQGSKSIPAGTPCCRHFEMRPK